jgi:hypothetical protein
MICHCDQGWSVTDTTMSRGPMSTVAVPVPAISQRYWGCTSDSNLIIRVPTQFSVGTRSILSTTIVSMAVRRDSSFSPSFSTALNAHVDRRSPKQFQK